MSRIKRIACDRCHRMKLKCGKGDPCDRCMGLGIPCTYRRNLRKIGRPKSKKEFAIDKEQKFDLFVPKENELSTPHISDPNLYTTVGKDVPCNNEEFEDFKDKQGTFKENFTPAFTYPFEQFENSSNPGNSYFETFLEGFESMPTYDDSTIDRSEHTMDKSPLIDPQVLENRISNFQFYEGNGFKMECIKINNEEKFLINYFTNEVCNLLFTDPIRTEFIDIITPLCLKFEQIKFPVIAISCSRIYFSEVEEDTNKANSSTLKPYIRDRMHYKSIAETIVLEDKTYFENGSRECYIAFICLILLDIIEGDSMRWKTYLKKIFSLLQKEGGLSSYIERESVVGKIILYLDIITSFTDSAGIYIKERWNKEDYVYLNSHSLTNMGIVNRLKLQSDFNEFDIMYFENVANLSSLSHLQRTIYQFKKKIENESLYLLTEEKDKLTSEQELLTDKFSNLTNLIENTIQADIRFGLPDCSFDQEQQQKYITDALRWSSYIRLHQIIFGSGQKHCWRVKHSLKSLILCLKLFDLKRENKKILFPLIIAASVAIDKEDRNIIMEVIKDSIKLFRFSCLCHVRDMIERMWQDNRIYDSEHNFDRILYFEYPGLVIL